MKKLLLIWLGLYSLSSCSRENKKSEAETKTFISITNNVNTDSISLESTGSLIKDAFLILDTLNIGYHVPKLIWYGTPNEIKIDTSEYGEIESFENSELAKSDTLAIRGFYMDTRDYTTTKYNKEGIIREYRFDGTFDHSFQKNYYYSDNKLDSITIINQAIRTLISKKGEPEKWENDLLSKISINYGDNQNIETLDVIDGRNFKTLYNTVYH